MIKLYCGIDIGRQGGIAFVNTQGKLVAAYKMPLTASGETDALKLATILAKTRKKFDADIFVIYEKLNSFFGLRQNAIVGVSREAGIVQAVVQIVKMPYDKVAPKKWQNYLFKGEKIQFKLVKVKGKKKPEKKIDTKKMSEVKFVKIFPNYKDFPVITKSTGTLRDGIVDAGNLAYYGKINNL